MAIFNSYVCLPEDTEATQTFDSYHGPGWQAWTKSWMRTSWPRGEKQPGKVMGKLLRKTSGNIILLVGSEDSFLVKT